MSRVVKVGEKGTIWKLPVVKGKELGKIGPGLGFGAGCGAGAGVGLMGGVGFGAGVPGLHFGFGIGIGCGVGFGFGYGMGRGMAYDGAQRHSNVGKLFHRTAIAPSIANAGALVDGIVLNTKKLIQATSKQIEKWR